MTDVVLGVDDFERFFAALWPALKGGEGQTAFPWQSQLVRQIDGRREWPDLVDLPTGTGKTSLLEMAVFLMALDAGRPPAARWMPRRVVLVVDRRVVVDQADARGARIANALNANTGVLGAVSARLRSLSGGGPPLVTTVLRGGIVRDETWARRPDVPALISSTVDQVGSRLLFRGYGLSSGMRPIHAGLLGNDVLFLLDEVHLARPFAETLAAVDAHRRHGEGHELPDRWKVVELTATPTRTAVRRFPDAPLDATSHPILARRLLARKPVRLHVVKVPKDQCTANEMFARSCSKLARNLLTQPELRTIGVIVNRVDTARRVARQLAEVDVGPQVVLLTGRMRSIDRDKVLDEWKGRLLTGRTRSAYDEPLVVVATQSIEAGADFDLDGIVTECASIDALRQRFGRVDRDGRLSEAGTPATSVVAVRSTDIASGSEDPVYGVALANTWWWLDALDDVDLGLTALAVPPIESPELKALVPRPPRAPRLLPAHLDRWAQTSQVSPPWEPDVASWLHGLEASECVADVQLVWRADLDVSLFHDEVSEPNRDEALARVAACPPVTSEALSVTIGDFRRWATRLAPDPTTSDVAGGGVPVDPDREERPRHRYLRWSPGSPEFVVAGKVRPGDTVVVPASDGGLWLGNWDPDADEPVEDVALIGIARQRHRALVRLIPPFFGGKVELPDPALLEHEDMDERRQAVRACLGELAEGPPPNPETAGALAHLADRRTPLRLWALIDGLDGTEVHRSYIATSTAPLGSGAAGSGGDLAADDGADAVSFTGVRVTLDAHLHGVAGWAERLAGNLGLAAGLVHDLGLAGRLHDLGKADTRFQRMLAGGNAVAAAEPLAKSSTPDTDRVARRRARIVSGYPARASHELLSVAMLRGGVEVMAAANDPDLVRYLVASHHGFGRYRFEPSIDAAPEDAAVALDGYALTARTDHGLHDLGAGLPEDFWALVRRYGWFELAWIEAILRLADHSRSRAEQEGRADELDNMPT